MAVERFSKGDVVRVWWTEDGKDFEYTARIIGPAQRKGDFAVEVITPGPGTGVKSGSRLDPILADDGIVGMELVERNRNRFMREVQGSADNAWFYSRGGLMVVAGSVATAIVAIVNDISVLDSVKAAGLATLTCLINWIRHRRYSARAQWMRDTPNWWERMDEAPTMLTFPRAVRLLRRLVFRQRPRSYSYE
jgi:hypothetical protein